MLQHPLVYAGIGPRRTPWRIRQDMGALAADLYGLGWRLSTGGAHGADAAFAEAVPANGRTLYLPWWGYNSRRGVDCLTLSRAQREVCGRVAAGLHPAWGRCSAAVRKLHMRNVAILLSPTADKPVDALICWTPDGAPKGGTAMGLRIADKHRIPTFNLALDMPELTLEGLRRIRTAKLRGNRRSAAVGIGR